MRTCLTIVMMVLVALPAAAEPYAVYDSGYVMAQAAPATTAPAPHSPPPAGTVYAGQPVYTPQATPPSPPYTVPQSSPAATSTYQAQPWDYGQSVTTDIRQMNF